MVFQQQKHKIAKSIEKCGFLIGGKNVKKIVFYRSRLGNRTNGSYLRLIHQALSLLIILFF